MDSWLVGSFKKRTWTMSTTPRRIPRRTHETKLHLKCLYEIGMCKEDFLSPDFALFWAMECYLTSSLKLLAANHIKNYLKSIKKWLVAKCNFGICWWKRNWVKLSLTRMSVLLLFNAQVWESAKVPWLITGKTTVLCVDVILRPCL